MEIAILIMLVSVKWRLLVALSEKQRIPIQYDEIKSIDHTTFATVNADNFSREQRFESLLATLIITNI